MAAVLARKAQCFDCWHSVANQYLAKVVVNIIPKLYAPNRTSILAHLVDTTICEVTEERNGIFELYLEIPTASEQYPLIENDCWVLAKPSEGSADQFFRVYSVEKNMAGIAIVQGEHLSYLLAAYPVDSVTTTNATATQAMGAVLDRAAQLLPVYHGFHAVSDIATASNFAISAVSARAALGGVSGSILQFYGGEYEFDNLTVRLHRERGRDRGVKIEYAKNLLALRASVSTERSFTGLFPFVKNEDSLLFLPERVLWVDNRSGVQRRAMVRDFTHDLGQEPSAEQLRAAAQSFLSANDINAPDISMDVDFVHLWQSPEYEKFRELERVALCDTVTVRHPDLGVDVAAKVIRTVYDTLRERYRRIIIGSAKSNMAAVLADVRAELEALEPPDIAAIQVLINQAVEGATNAISGANGGRVILHPPGNPQELLILTDGRDTIQTATRLWRFNSGGLGYSSNGYNGPYRTAITADGQIVADFITTGTLNANRVRAGIITSVNGTSFFDLDGNRIQTANITITGGSINITGGGNSTAINSTGLTTNNAWITGGQVSIGGNGFRTTIEAGELRQYDLGGNIRVCGLRSLSAGNEFRPTMYIGSNTRVTGFAIAREATGGFFNIAQFDRNRIDLINPVNITGALTTNANAIDMYAAVTHFRAVANWGTAQVRLGCGRITVNGAINATASIEMGPRGYTTPDARLDLFPSWGAALICLRGSNFGSNTGVLELGSTTMWWRGGAVAVSSTAELKEDIAPAPTALEKIARTGIYQYNYVGENERTDEQTSNRQTAAANRTVGFVIGGECTSPPQEVIAEDGESVNLYAAIAMAWKGIQELTAENRELRQTVQQLTTRVAKLEGDANENNNPPNARQPS